ncbi:MAG: colicin V production protein [marine bacterium B5-7]|nr:MAG: colicin V production protein [marine bacterium B5-7]
MIAVDYVILGLIGFSGFVGLMRGFAREVLSLISWALAFWLAMHFNQALSVNLKSWIHQGVTRTTVSFLLIFLGVLILGWMIGLLIRLCMQADQKSGWDRLLGLLFGALRGIVVVLAMVYLIDGTALAEQSWWQQSTWVKPFNDSLKQVSAYLPALPHFDTQQ